MADGCNTLDILSMEGFAFNRIFLWMCDQR